MIRTHLNYYRRKLTVFLAEKADMVQHREVIREVASGVERSWVYYLMLVVAGQIALLGLLTNSVAVVIGAMLISPLMGPIISSSLALTIGDLSLARRAFKTIAVSVLLTVAVSALISLVSPLKEPTAEILARVRPNILDLFVAALSGVAGAVALCTKRNYVVTATGVAVATAVIPPLSVVGYAMGTWQPKLALGGFLLFFTNFVAIVLASDLVFFTLGFRTSLAEETSFSHRTRIAVIGAVLALVSVPLVYTLGADVARLKEKKRIERILKSHLNREQVSRLTGYQQTPRDKELLVRASVNTVALIDRPERQSMEQELARGLKRPVRLELEQVIVASGRELAPVEGKREPLPVSRGQLSAEVGAMVASAEQELSRALEPFPVSRTKVTFAAPGEPLLITATLRRDYPLSRDELQILSRELARVLELPVELKVEAKPLLPQLTFTADGEPVPQTQQALEIVKSLPEGPASFRFRLSAPPDRRREALSLKGYLTGKLAVPESVLSVSTQTQKKHGVTLSVVRQ
uniref:TIGR00341 family protein n=1 Tax=Geobacter sp. (strain M21) TaxID=443144 RepID=C6E3G7_GEOSM